MQQFNEIPTLSDRLRQIVELSYTILCNKVAAGSFNVPNEASIQMQLGSIINWVGKMFEFDKHDRVVVELESPKEKSSLMVHTPSCGTCTRKEKVITAS